MIDRFPDAYGNEVIVRPTPEADGRIEIFCHAPGLYKPDTYTAMYLDDDQRQRLIAALTAAKETPLWTTHSTH